MYETTWVPVIVLTFHKRRESTNLQNEAPENRVTFSDARHFECGTLTGYGFIYLSFLWGWVATFIGPRPKRRINWVGVINQYFLFQKIFLGLFLFKILELWRVENEAIA